LLCSAEATPEKPSEFFHPHMRRTIYQLKTGTLSVPYLGIIADLAYCKDEVLARLFGEHLGAKVQLKKRKKKGKRLRNCNK
jgi:hypothetical protein